MSVLNDFWVSILGLILVWTIVQLCDRFIHISAWIKYCVRYVFQCNPSVNQMFTCFWNYFKSDASDKLLILFVDLNMWIFERTGKHIVKSLVIRGLRLRTLFGVLRWLSLYRQVYFSVWHWIVLQFPQIVRYDFQTHMIWFNVCRCVFQCTGLTLETLTNPCDSTQWICGPQDALLRMVEFGQCSCIMDLWCSRCCSTNCWIRSMFLCNKITVHKMLFYELLNSINFLFITLESFFLGKELCLWQSCDNFQFCESVK